MSVTVPVTVPVNEKRVLVIGSSPNTDGLTAACMDAAADGLRSAGATVHQIRLNDLHIASCEACGNGWGTCLNEHSCQVEDDFQDVHRQCLEADALVLVTPVYWGETSEANKAFTDRLRRCEATRQNDSRLRGKPIIAIAAAGGSGNGMITCLASMERWIDHVRLRKFDFVPVNRWNRPVKLESIRLSARKMVELIGEGGL